MKERSEKRIKVEVQLCDLTGFGLLQCDRKGINTRVTSRHSIICIEKYYIFESRYGKRDFCVSSGL